jgi:putative efflux protein, MATE family
MANANGAERLGVERVGRLLWDFSLQTTLSLLVYAIYSITDTYFLSVGISSLAAAGASIISPVLIALGGVATIVGAGGASIVSRALGEGDAEKASRTVANTFMIFWTAAIPISVVGTIFIEPIVYALGATESIAPYAIAYGRIIFMGAITSTGYSAIVRADGHAKFSTAMWVIPVLTNLALCWLFVMVLGLGAAGAATATVLGQVVSVGMSLYFFFAKKDKSYRITARDFRPDFALIGEVLTIGLPSFLKSLGNSLVVIITNNLLKTMGGDNALGAFAIVNRLYTAFLAPQMGIVQGMQPIVGYNFGKRKAERARRALQLSIASTAAYGLVAWGICLIFPGELLAALSRESSIVAEGRTALGVLALALPIGGVSMVAAAYFQSIGRAGNALIITLGGILVVRLPLLFALSELFGLLGIWGAWPASEAVLCAVSAAMLRRMRSPSAPVDDR